MTKPDSFDIQPWIDDVQRQAADAMETAARDVVIAWLRQHGYTVIAPGEQEACQTHEPRMVKP